LGRKGRFALAAASALVLGTAVAAHASDPFAPRPLGDHGSHKAGPRSLHLDGILITPYTREAVINGHTLTPGESIAGARLERVSHDRAVLVRGGHRIALVFASDPRASSGGRP